MSFAFVPFYIKFMGIEAYGLVGFFASVLAVFMVLDLGLSTTISKELAQIDDRDTERAAGRTLLRSLELVYWGMAFLIGVGIALAAPWIARSWLQLNGLAVAEATTAVRLMGVVALLRWPVTLYTGALMGLRRHVSLNLITGTCASAAGLGAVLVLWRVAATPTAFFIWQAVIALVQILLLRSASWRYLKLTEHAARVQVSALRSVVRFSAGIAGTTLLSVVLTQLDKAVLSRVLPLDQFGYYVLASSIAMLLTTAAGALNGALFPSIVNRVARHNEGELTRFYHQGAELVGAVIIPAGVTLAIFSSDLLMLYLRDSRVVAETHLLLSLFSVGNMLLALMIMPVALQLAHGWTTLTLYTNVIAVLLFVPLLLVMVQWLGAIGAILVWIMLTLGYLIIQVPVMHRRLLPQAQARWYLVDVGVPLALSLILVGAARLLVAPLDMVIVRALLGCCAGGAAMAASLAIMPESRAWLLRQWSMVGSKRRI